MSIDNETLFSELFSYYRDLENRRWQYFAGLLIVDGLFLNAWSGLSNPTDPSISTFLCIGAIFVGIAFLRMLSRSRRRINEVAAELNKLVNRPLMNVGGLGFWGLGGITMWLYLSAIVLTLPWFFTLWALNPIVTIFSSQP